jgi:vitamin B12 transporter
MSIDSVVSGAAATRPLAVALAMALWGATLPGSAIASTPTQPTVVVTATRTPVTVDAALAAVTVLDRDDLEAAGSLDLVALLRGVAGIDVVRGGGVGQQTSVFLRGSNSNQVLVLVDGVRVASANTGGYAWEQLPLAQIERIEIVRGPRAALYGSDAIGGVIQVFTRRPQGPSGTVGIGSHGTRVADAAIGAGNADSRAGLRAAYSRTDGFSAQNEAGFAFDPDDDGYRQRSLAADASHAFAALRVEGQALASDSDVEFDIGESQVSQRSAQLALRGSQAVDWRLAASWAREVLDTPDFFNRFESRRRQLDWQHVMQPRAGAELVWGLSSVEERGASIDTFSNVAQYRGSRDHQAGFLSWRDGHAAWQWELAGRHDDYDGFGGHSTAQAALGWQLAAHSRLKASVGEGFRAPNLNELFSPGFFGGFFAGNPDLQPERSRAWEVGGEHAAGAVAFGWRAYRNDVRDLVDFSGGDTFQAINIGRARLQGAEADVRWTQGDLSLSGNLTWLQARNRDTDSALLRRAPRQANLRAEHALGRGSAGLMLHASSARPEFGGDLPGYAVLSAFLRWPLGDRLDLDLRLENLTDRDYELVRGFNTAGASGLLQLRWRMRD